jgi:ribosomal-protein-alanine N-acetyltransferase
VSSILTKRLDLALLPVEFLEATAAGMSMELPGVNVPEDWWREREIAAWRLADIQADEGYHPWSLRAIVCRDTGLMVGFCGFHTSPNPAYLTEWIQDAVEISYSVFPSFRRRGFATETAQGLMRWAHQRGVKHIVGSTGVANAASAAVLRRLGFTRVRRYEDPIDGPEDVWVRDASVWAESTGVATEYRNDGPTACE